MAADIIDVEDVWHVDSRLVEACDFFRRLAAASFAAINGRGLVATPASSRNLFHAKAQL